MRKELVEDREKLGLTQETMAAKLGISRSFYGLIETGARNPSYGLAVNIATVLNKNIQDLFFDLEGFRMKPEAKSSDRRSGTARRKESVPVKVERRVKGRRTG